MEIDLINGTYCYRDARLFGIKRYIKSLHDQLPHIGLNVIEYHYRRFHLGAHLDRLVNDYIYHPSIVRKKIKKGRIRLITSQQFLYLLSATHLSPCAVVCHDLIRLTRPQDYPSKMNAWLTRNAYGNFKKTERIIAVSQYVRSTLLQHYNLRPEKISVVSNAVDTNKFFPDPERGERFRKRWSLPEGPIVLYVGSEEPRKNLGVLLQAFALIRRKYSQSHLLKIGQPQYPNGRTRFMDEVAKHKLSDALTLIDSLPDDSEGLPAAYNAANIFMFPSIDEGFGLPALEALASGTPVVASAATAIPEVVGQGGVLVPFHDPAAFALAALELLENASFRDALIMRGREQAHRFSWKKNAVSLERIYQEMADGI